MCRSGNCADELVRLVNAKHMAVSFTKIVHGRAVEIDALLKGITPEQAKQAFLDLTVAAQDESLPLDHVSDALPRGTLSRSSRAGQWSQYPRSNPKVPNAQCFSCGPYHMGQNRG